jgi:hypothetical protein
VAPLDGLRARVEGLQALMDDSEVDMSAKMAEVSQITREMQSLQQLAAEIGRPNGVESGSGLGRCRAPASDASASAEGVHPSVNPEASEPLAIEPREGFDLEGVGSYVVSGASGASRASGGSGTSQVEHVEHVGQVR